MLHILGMIGKGIGIALVCILILAVVLLLAVLFAPIRYRVTAGLADEKATGMANAHWLLHIITASCVWEQELQYKISIFGIAVYGNKRKALKEKKKKEKEQKKEQKELEKRKQKTKNIKNIKNIKNEKNIQNEAAQSVKVQMAGKAPEQVAARRVDKNAQPMKVQTADKAQKQPSARCVNKKPEQVTARRVDRQAKRKKHRRSPLKALMAKLKALLEKLKAFWKRVTGLFQKAEKLKETIAAYRAFFEREDFKRAFALCKKELLTLWKRVRPKKLRAELHFGFDDPALTGQILAYLSMLYPLLGKDVRLRPDFENRVCEGKLLIKGKIRLFVLLRALWILYFDKDIKRLIRIWKKEDALYGRE